MPPGGGKGMPPIGGAALLGEPDGGKGGKGGGMPRPPAGAGGVSVCGGYGGRGKEGEGRGRGALRGMKPGGGAPWGPPGRPKGGGGMPPIAYVRGL